MTRKLTEERHKEEREQEIHREQKKKTHRVRANHWVKGILETIDKIFDSIEEAIEYAEGLDCTSAKKRIAGLLDKLFIVPTLPRHCH